MMIAVKKYIFVIPAVCLTFCVAAGAEEKNLKDYFQEARASQKKGALENAEENYTKAIELNRSYEVLYYGRGEVRFKKNDLDGAIAEWRAAVQVDPKYPPAQINLAEALENKGDMQGAIAAYERFLTLVPNGADAEEVRKRVERLRGDTKSPATPEKK